MKILVPVDIYDKSHAPYEYAVQLASRHNAKITLIHVIHSIYTSDDMEELNPYDEMEKAARIRLDRFVSEYQKESGNALPSVDTNIEIGYGITGRAIGDFAKENNIDLIIMGVRDKHGFLDRVLGSASSETIKEAECPVMLIPQDVNYKNIEKVLFAFDKNTDMEYALEEFKKINNTLKAKTDFLHINVQHKDDISKQKSEIVSELFEKEDPKFAFEVKSLSSNKVLSGLNDYCYFEKIDLITMIHREGGVFANFFTPSKSIEVAQNFHAPVLVLKQK